MLPPVQSQMPGFEAAASLCLRALLLPDGSVSHYEVEARTPAGDLTAFWAKGDGEVPPSEETFRAAVQELEELLSTYFVTMQRLSEYS